MSEARAVVVGALVALTMTGTARAQQIVDAVAGTPFQESYDPIPNTSGGRLLGVRLVDGGEAAHGSGPLYVQPGQVVRHICVEAHSGDGRYSAANPFSIPESSASWVRIGSLSQAHKDTLDSYDVGEIAVRSYVVEGDTCTATDAVLLPASGDPAVSAGALEIQVNAGGLTVSAKLRALSTEGVPAPEAVEGNCGPADGGARLGFNTVCRLSLAELQPGLVQLDIAFDDGFSVETVLHRVLVPRPASQ